MTDRPRTRYRRLIVLGMLAVTAVAVLSAALTGPRPGGRMDPASTSPAGAHALVALLRERGVEVVVAAHVEDVERAARPDSLLLTAETHYTRGEELLRRLAAVPGDRLVVEPTAAVRAALAPGVRAGPALLPDGEPGCDLREAISAGVALLGAGDAYEPAEGRELVRCYGGTLARYRTDGRTVTVAGSAEFLTNGGLLTEGNAALALNLTGARPRLIWYAPQRREGDPAAEGTVTDLIPQAVGWVVLQLGVVVLLLALWKGRRLGPLVAERLPVVVRASETVEGRARLYRSRRARDQAGEALRTATLQRIAPRLGLGARPAPTAVLTAVAQRCGADPNTLSHILFGAAPATDDDLVALAVALDDIERKVTRS